MDSSDATIKLDELYDLVLDRLQILKKAQVIDETITYEVRMTEMYDEMLGLFAAQDEDRPAIEKVLGRMMIFADELGNKKDEGLRKWRL